MKFPFMSVINEKLKISKKNMWIYKISFMTVISEN
jgi:hypothetical protein